MPQLEDAAVWGINERGTMLNPYPHSHRISIPLPDFPERKYSSTITDCSAMHQVSRPSVSVNLCQTHGSAPTTIRQTSIDSSRRNISITAKVQNTEQISIEREIQ